MQRASEYWTYGSSIFTNAFSRRGIPTKLFIKGVAWFGFETSACHIGGATAQPLHVIAAWLKSRGFNAVRVPFAAGALLEAEPTCMQNGELEGIRKHNPQLLGMSYLERLKEVIRVAGDAGLLVLLVRGNSTEDASSGVEVLIRAGVEILRLGAGQLLCRVRGDALGGGSWRD